MKNFNFIFSFCFFLLISCACFSQETDFKESLIGSHLFGVQFIWDGYGSAKISKNQEGVLHIKGEQYSNNKEEYVLLDGIITIIDERNIKIKGTLKLFTEGCCGLLDREIANTTIIKPWLH